jgi:putative transposase
MARLPRLVLPGQAHYLVQRGHGERAVFTDSQDRQAYRLALTEAADAAKVQVHAYALLDDEVQLLVTPSDEAALGRMVQTIGRRYVSAYNRRHGCTGTLWSGRYRCAVVQPGAWRLGVLRWIDGLSAEPGLTSAGHRNGGQREPLLIDPPEVWELGNTPFDRESAYRALLAQGTDAGLAAALRQAALGGWALGSVAFAAEVEASTARPSRPRSRGRPRRPAG